jgi:hypothetical protein
MNRHALDGAVLLASHKDMAEMCAGGNRRALCAWLATQRVEGPGVSASLAEYIRSAIRELEKLSVAEQVARVTDLETRILSLGLRDVDRSYESRASSLGDLLRTHDVADLIFGAQPWYPDFLKGTGGTPPPASYSLPLEHRRYKKSDERWTINPGRIGANFVHTWALDLVNVAGFRIRRGTPNDVWIRDSTWAGQDTLTVIDSCGRVLQKFTAQDFFSTAKFVDLENRPPCPHDAAHAPHTRIYLILETSRDPMLGASRSFKVAELEHTTALTGNEHAYVVADEINYDFFDTSLVPPNNEDFANALDAQGHAFVGLYPPWAGGPQGANDKIAPEFKTRPDPARGWYLLGLNTTYAAQKYYSVIYYNERRSVLRVYLYNLDEDTEYTAHVVKIYLEGCVALLQEPPANPELPPKYLPEWKPLVGAFFPVDPNPKNWWRAEFVVGGWAPHTWTAVEVPVLYPMGGNLPAIGDRAVGYYMPGNAESGVGALDLACHQPARTVGRYRSLYEDEFAPHQKNVRLVVSVRTFHEGYADLSLVAKAVGDAIQQSKPGVLSKMFDAIKTGKDWYGYASDFGKVFATGLDDQIKNASGAAKTAAENVKSKIETSFTVIGAVAAAAGALLKVTGVLPNDVLTLAITLSIQGRIGGTLTFQDMERENHFYLPGRFSMADAFAVDSIVSSNIPVSIDSCLPRYDRTLGLFGYAYQPWDVEATVNAELRVGQAIIHTSDYAGPVYTEDFFFFPARHLLALIPATRGNVSWVNYEERLLPDLLPVVVNPQAEIDVIPAQETPTFEYVVASYRFVDGLPYDQRFTVTSSQIYLTAHDRANWRYWWTAWGWKDGVLFGQPEWRGEGNPMFPPPRVGAPPAANPNLEPFRVNVVSLGVPKSETSILPAYPRSFVDRRGVHVKTAYQGPLPTSSYAVSYTISGVEALNPTAPAPMLLTDILYCWKITYLYWGETRLPPGQAYPKVEEAVLSAPVTIRCPPEDPPAYPSSQFLAFIGSWFGADFVKTYLDFVTGVIAGPKIESSLLVQPTAIPSLDALQVVPNTLATGGLFDVLVRLNVPNPTAAPVRVDLAAYPSVPGLPVHLDVPSGVNSASAHALKAPAPGLYTITATAESNVRTANLLVK